MHADVQRKKHTALWCIFNKLCIHILFKILRKYLHDEINNNFT